MNFKLQLVVENMQQLSAHSHGREMIAEVEWRGRGKKAGFLSRFENSFTCAQKVQTNGTVTWNEGFDHICKFKGGDFEKCQSWIIALQIREVEEKGRNKTKCIGKATLDLSQFIQFEDEKSISIPFNCNFSGHSTEAILMIKLRLIKAESRSFKIYHSQSCLSWFKNAKVGPEENFKPLRIGAGNWEKKTLVSRDDRIELIADVFLASIDQCSKKASGGSACTVLAACIADWLHRNPKSLPLKRQFDDLVVKGSKEWRKLCSDKNHLAKFSDKHFDLETVLQAKTDSLTVDLEKSFVAFFGVEDMPEGFEWLQTEMAFDTIWNNIICSDVSDERIYIASWNDHFFVLKVQSDAIYMLDTLGERLSEGCKQAYILKFDSESVVYRHSSKELISQGIECCKEYIKGFLSAIPIREFQHDIKIGKAKQELLHRILQIDFHYTVPTFPLP